MLRLLFLVAGVGGFVLMVGFGPEVAIFASFGALFVNFATCCLQFEDANDRAKLRIRVRLAGLHVNSDEYQRLSTSKHKPTSADRHHPLNAMTMVNLGTGIACIAFCAWGVLLWVL